jgi:hypothetical protein
MTSAISTHVYEVRPRLKIDSGVGHPTCDDPDFQKKLISEPESATDQITCREVRNVFRGAKAALYD